jgi:hypothetical protein
MIEHATSTSLPAPPSMAPAAHRHGGVEHDEGSAAPIVHGVAPFVVAAAEDEAVAVVADSVPLFSKTRTAHADSVPPPNMRLLALNETELAVGRAK